MLRVALGLLLALAVSAGAANAQSKLFKPNAGSCGNYRGGLRLVASASPDMGGIEPATLVPAGTSVHLTGISEEIRLNGQCQVISQTPVPFTWRLTERTQAGQEIDRTPALNGASTLTPGFVAADPAIYFVTLSAAKQSFVVRIEAIRRGHGWVSLGPSGEVPPGSGASEYTGRVNDLAFDPNQPGRLYASTAWGGVFKSNDAGVSWMPMMDQKGVPHLGGGAIAVAPSGTVYAGLGDPHDSVDSGDPPNMTGSLWRSDDAGITWRASDGAGSCAGAPDQVSAKVTRIILAGAGQMLVSTLDGVLRSVDGGNCWQRVPGLEHGLFTDINLDPRFGDVIWAGREGARPAAGVVMVKGVWSPQPVVGPNYYAPSDDMVGWVALARAPSNPATVYFAISAGGPDGWSRADIVRTSTDANNVTQAIAINSSQCGRGCGWASTIAVDPLNDQHVIYAEVRPHHSTNGGSDYDGLADNGSVHGDFHALVFPPGDAGQVFAATDGGVYRLGFGGADLQSPDPDWEPRNADLSITQVTTLSSSSTTPGLVALGAWDNGDQQRTAGRVWSVLRGGDGEWVAYDAGADNKLYLDRNAGLDDGGHDILRYPDNTQFGGAGGFETNPYVPGELWAQRVNGKPDTAAYFWGAGGGWRCGDPNPGPNRLVNQVDFAPDGHYFVAAGDGTVWRFSLGGAQLVATCGPTTPLADAQLLFSETAGGDTVAGVAVDPFDTQNAYAVISSLSDFGRRVAYLSQGPAGWTAQPLALRMPAVDLTGAIAADPKLKGVIYVGTRHGLLAGTPDGAGGYSWAVEADVPETRVVMIQPERGAGGYTGVLRLSTYGRGIWERRLSTACTPAVCIGAVRVIPPCIPCLARFKVSPPPPATMRMEATTDLVLQAPLSKRLHEGDFRTRYVKLVPTFRGDPVPGWFFSRAAGLADPAQQTGLFELAYVPPEGAPDTVATDGLTLQQVDAEGRPTGPAERVPFAHTWRRPGLPMLRIEAFEFGPLKAPASERITVLDGRGGNPGTGGGAGRGGGPGRTLTTPVELPLKPGQSVQVRWAWEREKRGRPARVCTLNGAPVPAETTMTVRIKQDTVLSCGVMGSEKD